MLKEECTISFDPVNFVECDPCRHFYFKRVEAIKTRLGVLIITLHYDLRTCFLGLAKGDYLNTITLLPGEELGLEIVRRHKYTRELHEQTSLETEFENTFTETTRNTFNVTGKYKYTMEGEAGFKIFGIGAKVKTKLEAEVNVFYERFKEIIEQTRTKVSRKYDFSIDVTSESENTLRSTRKFKNPNNCHPVHYFISQMLKKYKSELILTKVEFDYQERIPDVFMDEKPSISVIKPLLLPFNYFIKSKREQGMAEVQGINKDSLAYKERYEMQPTQVLELSRHELLDYIPNDDPKAEVKKLIDDLEKRDEFIPGVKSTKEYCVRTADIYAEAKISPCSACCQDEC